jgi:hypothetical protein
MEKLSLSRLAATSEFRELNFVSQAALLKKSGNATYKQLEEYFDVPSTTIFRAKRAIDEGRAIGVNGRPTYFTPSELDRLIEIIKIKIQESITMTYDVLRKKVKKKFQK